MKKMKSYIISVFVMLLSISVIAQTDTLYYSGFDNASEQAGWQFYKLGVDATYGPWTLTSGGYSVPNCIYHDYNNTGTVQDWYVSPEIEGYPSNMSLKIKPYAIIGYPIITDYIGVWYSAGSGNPNNGQFVEAAELTGMTTSNPLWKDTSFSLPASPNIKHIGLKFMNEDNWFTVGIDNIIVMGISSSIKENSENSNVSVYPNPCNSHLLICSPSDMVPVGIFDLFGKKVIDKPGVVSGMNRIIDVSGLPIGMYVIKLVGKEGSLICKFVKE